MGHIVLCDRDNGLAAVNAERHRLTGKDITIRRRHLVKLVIAGVQRLRQHQPAFIRNIERIKSLRVRVVDFLRDKFAGRQVFDLEPGTGHRDNITGLGVTLLHAQPCGDGAVIQDIAVSLTVCGNKYCKVRNKSLSIFAGNLVDRIVSIWQHFRRRKTIAVRRKQVALTFFRRIIAAGSFQVNLKDSAGLRSFNGSFVRFLRIFFLGHIRVRVIRMLDKLNVAVNHSFRDVVFRCVQLHFIQRRGRAHLINGIIQKITGTWFNLTERPVIAADIIAGHKTAVRPGGVGIYQFTVIEQAISCACQGSIALGGSGICVALYYMDAEFLQNITEMDSNGLSALNRHILRGRCHIAVYRNLGHKISTGKELLCNLPVFPGGNILVDFISQNIGAGNVKRNPGHNAVLTGLDNLCGAVGLRLDFYEEGNRVTGAGHHGLITRSPPNQHIVCNRNILAEFKGHRVHNHVPAGKGVLVAVSGNGHAAAGKIFQIDIQVVGIGNSQGINLFVRVPFQFQLRGLAFLGGSKGRNRGMGSDLRKNPVIGFLRRTPGNHAVILICGGMTVTVTAVRVAPKLLLVFPEYNLSCHLIIILIDSGNGKGGTGFPAVNSCQGNPSSCFGREKV